MFKLNMTKSSFFVLSWASGGALGFLSGIGAFDGSFELENSVQGLARIFVGAFVGHLLFWFVCKRLGKDVEMRSTKKLLLFLFSSFGVWSLYFATFAAYAYSGVAIAMLSLLLFITAPIVVQLVVRGLSASKSTISSTSGI
jgi:drug/metabolite transporter (DMT)-like permease